MRLKEGKSLEEWIEDWARDYGALGVLGFLFAMLAMGKVLHDILLVRGRVCMTAVVPTALLGGVIGLVWFIIMCAVDPALAPDLAAGLTMIKTNLVNFVFTSFILGLSCARTSSQHLAGFRPLLLSIYHEGMPMAIYSQILIWGQSAICLLACLMLKVLGTQFPSLASAMVPLGMESGPDVVPPIVFNNEWSESMVQEAESYSLWVTTIIGITLLSMRDKFQSWGWIDKDEYKDVEAHTDQQEAFRRSASGAAPRSRSFADLTTSGISIIAGASVAQALGGPKRSLSDSGEDTEALLSSYSRPEPIRPISNYASFGTHMSIIFLTAFLAFIFGFFTRIFEAKYTWFEDHHFFSGFCLFEVSMCFALIGMQFLLRYTTMVFNREWFMRLCGIMLDLLVIGALTCSTSMYNESSESEHHAYSLLVASMVLLCGIWNLYFMFYWGTFFFPNYWFDRGLVLLGDSMGHSFMGLLFARALDYSMETPVPTAFAYKSMLIFIPTSVGKNSIVVSLVSKFGILISFIACVVIIIGWIWIFRTYFKPRFVHKKKSEEDEDEAGAVELSRIDAVLEVEDDSDVTGTSLRSPMRRPSIGTTLISNSSSSNSGGAVGLTGSAPSPSAGASLERRDSRANLGALDVGKADSGKSISMNPAASDCYVVFKEKSGILSNSQLKTIGTWLPTSLSVSAWELAFSLRRDGANLSTLIRRCCNTEGAASGGGAFGRSRYPGNSTNTSFIIVVEDSWGYVFGGFIAHGMHDGNEYYGTGENFVFTVSPMPKVFKWTGDNDFFVVSNQRNFALGGGGEGFALQLDDELATGVSNRSKTFNNDVLASTEFFKCLNVEVWQVSGFSSSGYTV
jgi:hypothetical protein